MKIVIFGIGSIGSRHARILKNGFGHELYAFRSGNSRPTNKLGLKEIRDWRKLEDLKPDVAFITNPTSLHIKTAIKCASLGTHLFIEKPLSDSLKGLDRLEAICRRNKLTCYTAYCLRFHPVIEQARRLLKDKKVLHVRAVCSSYLPEWRQGRDFKKSYSANSKMGGGVLLDLSHELDYLQYLFSDIRKIKAYYKKTCDVTVDAEDCADLILVHKNGAFTNLHLNFMSRISERNLKVDFAGGCLIGDLMANRIAFMYRNKRVDRRFSPGRDDYLKKQTEYFLNNIGNPRIINGLKESKKLLVKILEIKNAR